MSVRFFILTFLGLSAMSLLGCPGDGGSGPAPRLIFNSTPECIVFPGGFPSGFIALPDNPSHAAVVQIQPPQILGLDLDQEPPSRFSPDPLVEFPLLSSSCARGAARFDSDSDGFADRDFSRDNGFTCNGSPVPGSLRSIAPNLVGLMTSSYEQILFMHPADSALQFVQLDTPPAGPAFDPVDWPFWPTPGTMPFRTGISTRTCVYGSGFLDSTGDPIGANAPCDTTRDGFFTGFTADAQQVGNRLYVAMSNFDLFDLNYAPGTLLVFEYDTAFDPPRVRPHPDRPVLLTEAYNPTSLTPYTTPAGRELILVGLTGSVESGTGPNLVRTDSAIDILDVATDTLIATIPLARAGLGFTGVSIDATRRIGLIGAATSRALFAIDLAALDDPMLGLGPEPLPIRLDGQTAGFGDARIFDGDQPFLLDRRAEGPSDSICASRTDVAIKPGGDFAVVSDFCDGTLSVLDLELPSDRSEPIDSARVLQRNRLLNVTAPIIDAASGLQRGIERVLIRGGTPGIDFTGPDVHFTLGLTEGAVCGVRVE